MNDVTKKAIRIAIQDTERELVDARKRQQDGLVWVERESLRVAKCEERIDLLLRDLEPEHFAVSIGSDAQRPSFRRDQIH